jgi:hypothetical protein
MIKVKYGVVIGWKTPLPLNSDCARTKIGVSWPITVPYFTFYHQITEFR